MRNECVPELQSRKKKSEELREVRKTMRSLVVADIER